MTAGGIDTGQTYRVDPQSGAATAIGAPIGALGESDPWLLAVSPMLELTPAQVVAIYARRMQIEQSFRDLKSHRYGVGWGQSRHGQSPRMFARTTEAAC